MTSHGQISRDQLPLLGVILCCTSIPTELRSEMAAIAKEMGAIHKLDLTTDTTHLIVGSIDTPKYNYTAKERPDIKALRPEWLEAVRNSWMQGGDTDVAALEKEYRIPALDGLRICVTGFDDPQQRAIITTAINANGASYHGDLSRYVTHLIAAAPNGKKYEYAGQWGIKIVALEWLQDSLTRGLVLDESCYHPSMPIEERGKGAIIRQMISPQSLGKRRRDEDQPPQTTELRKRKLRRTTSNRLESQNDNMWADIGSGQAAQTAAGITEWDDTLENTMREKEVQPVTRHKSINGKTAPHIAEMENLDTNARGIFSGERLFIYGFDERKTSILRENLVGANIQTQDSMVDRFEYATDDNEPLLKSHNLAVIIVVPHELPRRRIEELISQGWVDKTDTFLTEWWVEESIFKKRMTSHDNLLSNPFGNMPIKGSSSLTICSTNFDGIELKHFSEAVKLIGAKYDGNLTPQTSVLVCNQGCSRPEKLRYALEQNIPVVTADWFYHTVRQERILDTAAYALCGSTHSRSSSHLDFYHPSINPRPTMKRDIDENFRQCAAQKKSSRVSGLSVEPVSHQTSGSTIAKSKKQLSNKPSTAVKSKMQEGSQPLQELAPEVNSPQKQSQGRSQSIQDVGAIDQDVADSNIQNHELRKDLQALPQAREKENDLQNAIAQIFAQKKPTNAVNGHTSEDATQSNRRHRPLGRAPSNPSSLGHSVLSRTNSSALAPSYTIDGDSFNDDTRHYMNAHTFQPSQALTYENPEAAATMEKLRRRMGLESDDASNMKEGGRRKVKGIGKVKDLSVTGGERRTRRRKQLPADDKSDDGF